MVLTVSGLVAIILIIASEALLHRPEQFKLGIKLHKAENCNN